MGARRLGKTLNALLPPAIIVGLLYAAIFVQPSAHTVSVLPPVIEHRDQFYGIAAPAADIIWAAGAFGKVIRSDDAGRTWRIQPTKITAHLQSIAAWNSAEAVSVGNDAVVIVTRDGGRSWAEVPVPRSSVANKLLKVRISGNGNAWAVGEMGAVLVSKDRGASWARALPEEDVAWSDVAFAGERSVLVGEFGRIKLSADGGASWRPIPSPVQSSLTAVAFRDPLHGAAVGLEGVILVTNDAGESWTRVQSPTRQHLFDVVWGGDAWIAVGARGITLQGSDASGTRWVTLPIAEQAFGWYTEVLKQANRYLFAGATLAVSENGPLRLFGQRSGTENH